MKIIFKITLFFIIFVFGYSIGAEQLPLEKTLKLFFLEQVFFKNNVLETLPILYDTNPSDLVDLYSDTDVISKRQQLINYIWKQDYFPSDFPTSIEKINDPRFTDLQNLSSIEKLSIDMEFGVQSYPYLFLPKNSNNQLIIYHQGHGGDFVNGYNVIDSFLQKEYAVLAFSMPLKGINNQPIVNLDDIGTIKLSKHDHLRYLESEYFSPLKYYFHPISTSINYIERDHHFESYHMIGLSGGAWTSEFFSAMDDRVSKVFSVAGPMPLYISINVKENGDYETNHPELNKTVNSLELLILSSFGEKREFYKIVNKFDPCCHGGITYELFDNSLQKNLKNFSFAHFEIFSDTSHTEHKISEKSLEFIFEKLNN